MIARVFSAGLRALLMAWIVAMPGLLLPGVPAEDSQIFMFAAFVAGGLTFLEYFGSAPSFIEFRDAPPFNRMRFFALFAMLVLLTLVVRQTHAPTAVGYAAANLGAKVGHAMDFPFSPVRLAVLIAPETAPQPFVELLRALAGLAYLVGLFTLCIFVPLIRILGWPIRKKAFNVWVNLPLFDPTTGGDVVYRLKRDAHVNVALGFLLPFLIPAVLKSLDGLGMGLPIGDPQALIWVMTAWAFLPTALIMRGVALWRVVELIEEKRRRAYAQSDVLQSA
ncbi:MULTISPECIES: hypothetical protein [unclassified Roseivivax]|uniref:hypothetical protein n=1 Tax=Roseivivax sp. GX 12232 TaxID=2900547 RepID=UPI001E3EBE82|nr:hypothetical protein [Roseivivax sp. GX 12232]MCE0506399.1 hypothetical protein [Roseivivax sp. GX 12232]